MSDYNTNYSVKDATSSSNVDLTNIFQLNPNSPSITTTFFNPPYTISGTAPFVEYVSGWYILTFNSSSSITFNTITTVYTTVVGGGGGGNVSTVVLPPPPPLIRCIACMCVYVYGSQ